MGRYGRRLRNDGFDYRDLGGVKHPLKLGKMSRFNLLILVFKQTEFILGEINIMILVILSPGPGYLYLAGALHNRFWWFIFGKEVISGR